MMDIARLKLYASMFRESPRLALAYFIAPSDLKVLIALGAERELAGRAIQQARNAGVTDAQISELAGRELKRREAAQVARTA